MREINIIAVKDGYRNNHTLDQTVWEVIDKHYLMQTENPDVYIVDNGIYNNNQPAFEEEVIRLINLAKGITNDNATYDCLNLILHKSDFDEVNYLSQYCRVSELCVPERIIKNIIGNRNLGQYTFRINVYLFSHVDDSKITQCLEGDSGFPNLSNVLKNINETWMAYWYVTELKKTLREGDIDLDTEEYSIIESDLEHKIADYDKIDNNDRKRICHLFENFCWDKIETNTLTKEYIMSYIKELRNIYERKEN